MKFTAILMPVLCIVLCGCARYSVNHQGRIMQKKPVTVAIVPAASEAGVEVSAPITLDKLWEAALKESGYRVVNADSVLTYASATGLTLVDLQGMLPKHAAWLGADLSVDYILCNRITAWGSEYKIIRSTTKVHCESVLYEACTGAVVWEENWTRQTKSAYDIDPVGTLITAAAHAMLSSMTSAEAYLAGTGIELVNEESLPIPGFAP